MRLYFLLLAFFLLPDLQGSVSAQNASPDSSSQIKKAAAAGAGISLDIARRHLRNFLTDKEAREIYGNTDEQQQDLHGAFMIGSPGARYVAIWDPTAARLVGVLDIKAPKQAPSSSTDKKTESSESQNDEGEKSAGETTPPSPYIFSAQGLPPFQKSSGAFGAPEYFGFRVVSGRPEFLYTHGSLRIEEMIWLEDGGNVLKQRFAIREPKNDVRLAVASDWKERITSSVGEWDGSTLKIPKDKAGEIELTYQLQSTSAKEEEE